MHSSSALVALILALVVVTSAIPKPRQNAPEDPEPILRVTTCGGFVEASSATIDFQPGGSIRADMRCIWTVRATYDSQRFNLVSSGLSENDGLYVTEYIVIPGAQQKLTTVGQNYTVGTKTVLVTLSVGHAPTFGFSLQFFSSGSSTNHMLSGHAELVGTRGNFSYPNNGIPYQNYEIALFTISPSIPAQPTLRFTAMALESDSLCQYDSVRTFTWFNDQYSQVARICGSTIPPSLTLQGGLGLISFTTDSSITGAGFSFEWE
ncbi:exoskeleton protein RP43 [Folsomia candida]|uniref:Cubilin n=1 Tax=Folsomia candida TaxID=158441 RepID=A0A226F0Z5_FOLCA|nr:exoskeleton protein RP43 [Folsomia candida]OXA62871.1 Cubilin [Folsomia candida]